MVSATIYITSKIYELWRWEILKHYLEDWIGNDSTIQKTDILYRFQRFVTNHSKNIQFLNGDTSWRLKLVPTIKKKPKKSGFVMVSGFLLPFHSCSVFDHSKSGCVRFLYPFCKLEHTVYSD